MKVLRQGIVLCSKRRWRDPLHQEVRQRDLRKLDGGRIRAMYQTDGRPSRVARLSDFGPYESLGVGDPDQLMRRVEAGLQFRAG